MLLIKVEPGGKTSMTVQDVPGGNCVRAYDGLKRIIGGEIESDVPTPEMYETAGQETTAALENA